MQPIRLISYLFLATAGCGGGGAAIDGPATDPAANPPVTPTNPTAPGAPTAPSAVVVSTPGTSFSPATITVAPGSVVRWQITGATHNVTFGAAKPEGGDIPDSGAGSQVSRTFPSQGTFDYQCTRHSGMTGRVLVTADGAAPNTPPANPSEAAVINATATAFSPERVEVEAGSSVTWEFANGAGGVVFDDDEVPPGGNITSATAGARVSRTFTAPGDYDYHSTMSRDIKGRVRVR